VGGHLIAEEFLARGKRRGRGKRKRRPPSKVLKKKTEKGTFYTHRKRGGHTKKTEDERSNCGQKPSTKYPVLSSEYRVRNSMGDQSPLVSFPEIRR